MNLTINDDFSDKGYLKRILAKPENKRDEVETEFLRGHISEEVTKARSKYASTPELRRMVALQLSQDTLDSMPQLELTGDGE